MQNREVLSVYNKKAKFCLFVYDKRGLNRDGGYKQLTHKDIANKTTSRSVGAYTILWYDAKMVNYLNLLEFINKKRIS